MTLEKRRTRLSFVRLALAAIALVAVTLLVVRVLESQSDSIITSDESLYLSEAVSIANGDATYSSGRPIVHRPPLYAFTLAPAFAWGDGISDARLIALAYGLAIVAALGWLARMLFGTTVAWTTLAFASIAATPTALAGSFFVDGPATLWLILSLCGLIRAVRSESSAQWSALSGLVLGLSFLTKETAIFWLPLPLLLVIISPQLGLRPRHVAAHAAAFALCAVPWFGWVAWQTGETYKLDRVELLPFAAAGFAAIVIAAASWAIMRAPSRTTWTRHGVGCVLLVAWAALSLYVLESRAEPHAVDYLVRVPRWLRSTLFPGVEPWPLVVAAWAWFVLRARSYPEAAPVLGITVALGVPVLLFTANAGWEPRQVVWIVCFSYVVLAWASVEALNALTRTWSRSVSEPFVIAAVAAIALIAGFASGWGAPEGDPSAVRNWRGSDERAVSAWFDDVPDGSTVLASRLFHSQLYVDHGGRFYVDQLPTLGLRIDEAGQPRPFGSMFRYEDVDLHQPRTWLWIGTYQDRPYYVGLAMEDLVAALSNEDIDYLLIAGDDAGFSSSLLAKFALDESGLRLLNSREDGGVRAYLFAVDARAVEPAVAGTLMSGDDFAAISARSGPAAAEADFWATLAPAGVWLDGDVLLEANDAAALARDYLGEE